MIYNVKRKFELDDDHVKKIEDWMEKQIEKDDTLYTLGERWEYRFLPTGLGTLITLKDGVTGDVLEVEGTENW